MEATNTLANQQRLSAQIERLPIKIVFVLNTLQDTAQPYVYHVRDYCLKKSIHIESREYDSHRYQLDRDQVERLPACHLFIDGAWKETFYLNTRPYQIIDDAISKYKKKREERLVRKSRFRKFWTSLVQKLKKLGHRKTRMEEWK